MDRKELKKYLEDCSKWYYAGEPIIPDAAYDYLEEKLEEIGEVGVKGGKEAHWYNMYSLKKYYEGDTKIPWDLGVWYCTPKLDGSAIALRYINNKLDSIITRGDGEFGDNITHLFTEDTCSMLGIPIKLNNTVAQYGILQVTGEVVAPEHIPNARNFVAGSLGLINVEEFRLRSELRFFPYDFQPVLPDIPTYAAKLDTLKELGFIYSIQDKNTKLYPTDGRVYRLDLNSKYEAMGFTSKYPRGAFALKERTEGVRTTLLDVVWQTGKTGKVTPVGIIKSVNIDGANVNRVTLNNPGFIEALGVQIGDDIMVERAGGIIPRVIQKVEE